MISVLVGDPGVWLVGVVTLQLWLVIGQDLVVDVVASLSGLLEHNSGLF